MEAIIIYYSLTGNTQKTAQILSESLQGRQYGVRMLELKPVDEARSFLGQAIRAFQHKKARIVQAGLNLSAYDLVCFGTPVWAFGPAPALNGYMAQCYGITNKPAILFFVCLLKYIE